MLCSVSSVSPNTHKQVHCSLLSTVPFTIHAGGDLCIYRDCEQWKTLIRCHVLHRPWSRLKEAFKHVLQNSSLSVCMCVSVWSPKAQWFFLTNCVIDHKKCWIAQSGQETGRQRCTRNIDWVNGGLCDGLRVGVFVVTGMNSVARCTFIELNCNPKKVWSWIWSMLGITSNLGFSDFYGVRSAHLHTLTLGGTDILGNMVICWLTQKAHENIQ